MSIRSELRTLIRLAPEVSTGSLSDNNCNLLLDKATIDLGLKGRALPRNEKFNIVLDQREYVVAGTSPILSQDDFLAIDPRGGGLQFYDGSRWVGDPYLKPVTREWLDKNYEGWRTASSAAVPMFWYLDTKEDNANDLVIGLVDKPNANGTDYGWLHYLSRGKLMTSDTHYPWTGTTTQLMHLEPYEMLLVYYVLEYYNRLIGKNDADADKYKLIYESGAEAMAKRMPLSDHLLLEGFRPPPYFDQMGAFGRGRH